MAVTFYAKKGATGIPLTVTLLDENGEIDLSGFSSVDLIVTVENTDDLLFTGTMDIHNDQVAHKGEARYEWQEGDLDTVGTFDIEIVAVDGSGREIRFPTEPDNPFYKLKVMARKEV